MSQGELTVTTNSTLTIASAAEKALDAFSARDRFLQIHDLRRFLLRYIDVYLY
jgi:hypothetical protein